MADIPPTRHARSSTEKRCRSGRYHPFHPLIVLKKRHWHDSPEQSSGEEDEDNSFTRPPPSPEGGPSLNQYCKPPQSRQGSESMDDQDKFGRPILARNITDELKEQRQNLLNYWDEAGVAEAEEANFIMDQIYMVCYEIRDRYRAKHPKKLC
ncbi:hypothetical protein FRC02_003781 [Tulasnella sp. 418]|nr:hypothetical protein FRC02_003781 [Tulasnella sp. 418]